MLEELEVAGQRVSVPGIQLVKAGPRRNELRCFTPENCKLDAPRIVRAIAPSFGEPLAVVDLSARYGDGEVTEDTYEIWFGAPGSSRADLRSAVPQVQAPLLFVQGTRDAFARADLLDALIERLGPRAELHRVEHADHSFGVLKRAGRTAADVLDEVRATLLGWLDRHSL